MANKIIFIDRDGTLIDEPEDKQVDNLTKFKLKRNVIPALITLKEAGYQLVMITNQDGLGTSSFKQEDFALPQAMLLSILESQGIDFSDILICPHFESDRCLCRKPNVGLVLSYLRGGQMDFERSYVIGDRQTDLQLSENMGIKGILYDDHQDWLQIAKLLIKQPRYAKVTRKTAETYITAKIDLDYSKVIQVKTGIDFFDHMLEQLAKHGGFGLEIAVNGDLNVDEHHTVEDTAIVIGNALRCALGDKLGIKRYGFVLPMDEALATVALDLSGRSYFIYQGNFTREKIGALPTELVPHFFRSFADGLGATLHMKIKGENTHHMIESLFKSVGRCLQQGIQQNGFELPTTKGIL